jgi:hypothetical protein
MTVETLYFTYIYINARLKFGVISTLLSFYTHASTNARTHACTHKHKLTFIIQPYSHTVVQSSHHTFTINSHLTNPILS